MEHYKILNKENLLGASGAGMFVLDKNEHGNAQMVLSGIFLGPKKDGSGGTGLQAAAIIEHLKATNLKAYNEVKAAIQIILVTNTRSRTKLKFSIFHSLG